MDLDQKAKRLAQEDKQKSKHETLGWWIGCAWMGYHIKSKKAV